MPRTNRSKGTTKSTKGQVKATPTTRARPKAGAWVGGTPSDADIAIGAVIADVAALKKRVADQDEYIRAQAKVLARMNKDLNEIDEEVQVGLGRLGHLEARIAALAAPAARSGESYPPAEHLGCFDEDVPQADTVAGAEQCTPEAKPDGTEPSD
jgi:hypothetical protein